MHVPDDSHRCSTAKELLLKYKAKDFAIVDMKQQVLHDSSIVQITYDGSVTTVDFYGFVEPG